MHTPQLAARSVRILAVPLLVAGVAAGIAPAAAARARPAGPAASVQHQRPPVRRGRHLGQ